MLHTRPLEQQTRILKHIQANSQMENNTHTQTYINSITFTYRGLTYASLIHEVVCLRYSSVTEAALPVFPH